MTKDQLEILEKDCKLIQTKLKHLKLDKYNTDLIDVYTAVERAKKTLNKIVNNIYGQKN